MGGSSWSNATYTDRATTRATTGTPTFKYDTDVKSGAVPTKVHPSLDPKGLKARESRDSDAHPNSNAIVVSLDVTGSMAAVVGTIHSKLPSLMGLLTRKSYIDDPQVLFMAVGDATCDRVPLQVGQFESGIEMEDNLTNFYLEQGGGGQQTESYELAAYVGARKTSMDCLEKRGRKGYFFIIGDENPYPNVNADQVKSVFGHGAEADVSTKVVFNELREKFHVFFVLPKDASNGTDNSIINNWKELVGAENVLKLEKAEGIAELIALQIGLVEGTTDVASAVSDLKDAGVSSAMVRVVTDSLSTAYPGGSAAIATVTGGSLDADGDSSIKRL